MTVTTDPNYNTNEFWSIDNVSLHQYGWSVTTFGGARYNLPPRRGDNIQTAYRNGMVFRPKQVDQRTITLTMFLVGNGKIALSHNDAIGVLAGRHENVRGVSTSDHRQRFNDSWDFLRRVVYRPAGAQVVLTRRWELTSAYSYPGKDWGSAGAPVGLLDAGAQIVAANAVAEVSGTMDPTMTGRQRADFQIDFLLADPFFYGAENSVTLHRGDSVYVWNDGNDVAINRVAVTFAGLDNPVLVNESTSPDLSLSYKGNIPGSVTADIGAFTMIAGNGDNKIANLVHKGARHWFGLQPGLNKLILSAASGSGTAVVTWHPPYV